MIVPDPFCAVAPGGAMATPARLAQGRTSSPKHAVCPHGRSGLSIVTGVTIEGGLVLGPVRAGTALLLGLIVCGRCGLGMAAARNNDGHAAHYIQKPFPARRAGAPQMLFSAISAWLESQSDLQADEIAREKLRERLHPGGNALGCRRMRPLLDCRKRPVQRRQGRRILAKCQRHQTAVAPHNSSGYRGTGRQSDLCLGAGSGCGRGDQGNAAARDILHFGVQQVGPAHGQRCRSAATRMRS